MPTSLSNTFQIERAVPGAYVTYRDREVVKILAVHDGGDYFTVETESGEVQTTVGHLSALWPDFGHCVWLESGDLHLTIKMGLDADTALPLGRRIAEDVRPLRLRFDPAVHMLIEELHCSFWPVHVVGTAPVWFPENAHVSYHYSTSRPGKTREPPEPMEFDAVAVMRCSGPRPTWTHL